MKTGKSISELAAEIERRAAVKKDFIVPTEKISVVEDAGRVALRFGDQVVEVNPLAHRQIAERTGIPAKYYDKMLAEAPDLLASNVEKWFKKYPARQMVRTLDGKARAFLSEKFRPLENEDLAAVALPVLRDLDLDIMSMEITDRRLYIKAVRSEVTRKLAEIGGKFGDGEHKIARIVSPAITISNSEVGLGALGVLVGLYDGFCSNLATFGERSMRKYHVGGKQSADLGEDVYALLSDKSRKLSDAALWSSVGDVIKAGFDEVKFNTLVDRVEGTANDKIDGDVIEVVNLASKRFGLNEAEGKGVLRNLIEGGSLTRFGLYNAITRTAADLEDYDRATEFERFGGDIIELADNDWQVLAKAA